MIIQTFGALARTDIKVEWLVEGLLSSGSWTYFVGPPGSGKSMLSIQLCDSLQEGKPFLGMSTTKRNCLYIQADAGSLEWKFQIENLAKDSFAWTVHDIERDFCDNERRVEYLHQLVWGTYPISNTPNSLSKVIKHVPYTFVVFDCLNKITAGDLNTKVAMSRVLQKLEYICSIYKCENCGAEVKEKDSKCSECEEELSRKKESHKVHFVLIHHPTSGKIRGVEAGSGYKGFAGECGNMLTLANNILVLEKCKVAKNKELRLDRDSKTGAWYVLSEKMSKQSEEDELNSLLGIQ